MSEFEIATLDYQAATLAARHAGLWIAAAHVVVGVLQTAVVGYGIYAMIRANRERAEATEASAERAERESDRRHAENMAALKALIDGQAEQHRESEAQRRESEAQRRESEAQRRESEAQRHILEAQAESLKAQAQSLDAHTRSLDAQTRSLEALLERTAPKRDADR